MKKYNRSQQQRSEFLSDDPIKPGPSEGPVALDGAFSDFQALGELFLVHIVIRCSGRSLLANYGRLHTYLLSFSDFSYYLRHGHSARRVSYTSCFFPFFVRALSRRHSPTFGEIGRHRATLGDIRRHSATLSDKIFLKNNLTSFRTGHLLRRARVDG